MIKTKESYTLRQVVELTGISEFTLRAWELRYKAIRPHRTETGRRRYSSEDILRAKALLDLTALGHRIGSIAELPLLQLQTLLAERNFGAVAPAPQKSVDIKYVNQTIAAADDFDWDRAEAIFERMLVKLRPKVFIRDFVLPLIFEINNQVAQERFTIAQEHIFSAMIRDALFRIRRRAAEKLKSKTRFLFATPEGDFHDTGLLIAAVMASLEGLRHLYLGANVPARDLCDTALRYKASHIVVSSTISKAEGAREDLFDWLHFMDRHLSPSTSIWIAGRNTSGIQMELRRGFLTISSFSQLEELLSDVE